MKFQVFQYTFHEVKKRNAMMMLMMMMKNACGAEGF